MRVSEADLDHAFAGALTSSITFQKMLLSRGRFARYAPIARLLNDEQAAARRAKHWWKHWWCRMPDGSEGETDIFAVFEAGEVRFALHIENKPADGKLLMGQAARYRPRAAFKAFDPAWLNYSDFETIIVAPREFIAACPEESNQFDIALSYEDIGPFVPLFQEALSSSQTASFPA